MGLFSLLIQNFSDEVKDFPHEIRSWNVLGCSNLKMICSGRYTDIKITEKRIRATFLTFDNLGS